MANIRRVIGVIDHSSFVWRCSGVDLVCGFPDFGVFWVFGCETEDSYRSVES